METERNRRKVQQKRMGDSLLLQPDSVGRSVRSVGRSVRGKFFCSIQKVESKDTTMVINGFHIDRPRLGIE